MKKARHYYYSRRGQLNFSCATCHVDNVGNFVRSEQLSPMIGQAAHWPVFRAGTELVTLQARFRQCQKQVRAAPLEFNSEEYNNLEYFLTYHEQRPADADAGVPQVSQLRARGAGLEARGGCRFAVFLLPFASRLSPDLEFPCP